MERNSVFGKPEAALLQVEIVPVPFWGSVMLWDDAGACGGVVRGTYFAKAALFCGIGPANRGLAWGLL